MLIQARLVGSAGLAISLGLGLTAALQAALQAAAQPDAMEVTSDTPAYCLRLLDRVSNLVHASPAPLPDVTRLSNEGRHLCGQGHIRGGILRLRRAWLLLNQPSQPPH
jgi:hypothetical protein